MNMTVCTTELKSLFEMAHGGIDGALLTSLAVLKAAKRICGAWKIGQHKN